MKQQYIPLDTPPEQAELIMLDRIHPDSPEGRAILMAYNQRSVKSSAVTPMKAESVNVPKNFKRTEIFVDSSAVENSVRIGLSFAAIGIGALIGLAALAYGLNLLADALFVIGMNLEVFKYVIAGLLVVALIYMISKIRTSTTVKREYHQTNKPNVNIKIDTNVRVN